MRCKVEFILIGLYGIRTHNHFVQKQTFSHSLILAYFFCQITELCYDYFMMHFTVFFFFSCHICVLEWIFTLELHQCQETLCSKHAKQARIILNLRAARGFEPRTTYFLNEHSTILSVIRQECKSPMLQENRVCQFSEKWTFLTPWHARMHIRG